MASLLIGVWELVSDTAKSLWMFSETYHVGVIVHHSGGRQGIAGPYTLEDKHFHSPLLVSVATNVPISIDQEIQRDGDTFTTKILDSEALSPTGQVYVYRKLSDLTSTSPFAGVWELIAETDKALNLRTDTHWVTVVNRGDFRRGFGGTYTVEGTRVSHTILFDTALNAPAQIDLEFYLEGEQLIAKRLAGTVSVPTGHVDQWRKIA